MRIDRKEARLRFADDGLALWACTELMDVVEGMAAKAASKKTKPAPMGDDDQ